MYDVPLLDEDAQRLYINSMISNPELFAKVNNILQPAFFDPHLAKGVKFIQEYFHEYRSVPADSVFRAATKLATEHVHLPRQDMQFVAEQIASFCKFQACIEVIRRATGKDGYFEKGDLGTMVAQMKKATEIGLLTDFGIDYFNDPLARLEADETEDPVISTGWKTVDDVIGGGVGRQELITFLAPSGGGKSVSMANLGKNLLAQGLHGVYISLEMRDKKVARRLDQMLARMHSGMINMNKTQVADAVSKFHEQSGAKFWIKRMREGSNANDILAYLRELESAHAFRPDFVIADYLDIMGAVQKGAGESMFLKDKFVSEEVRAIGFDYDCIMISASQLGKHATNDIEEGRKMHQGDVQGGSSKTNTSDLMIATVKTDAMHEAGEYRFEFPKSRNSDATTKQVTMGWDKNSLRIFDMGKELPLNKKKSTMSMQNVTPGAPKKTLTDLTAKYEDKQ
ncbi:DnaB-like helicase C-terminal domain-containing protein [Acinetobacter sp.]|uniref:DnaB-like helicase C-terminal domain-containing protein n=1 Tax=Acinetobacter sp. TaxID=472 RepID=UPI00388FE548